MIGRSGNGKERFVVAIGVHLIARQNHQPTAASRMIAQQRELLIVELAAVRQDDDRRVFERFGVHFVFRQFDDIQRFHKTSIGFGCER